METSNHTDQEIAGDTREIFNPGKRELSAVEEARGTKYQKPHGKGKFTLVASRFKNPEKLQGGRI